MTGEHDPVYVLARKALMDALDALGPHRNALVLVGAQAVYIHAGESDLAVAPYTTDGDFVVNPDLLGNVPLLEDALRGAGFELIGQPGIWQSKESISIDLLVPESLGGKGRRGARLGVHGNRAARKSIRIRGGPRLITTARSSRPLIRQTAAEHEILVAGPGALLVSKAHKIVEREGQPGRVSDKDALDVLRLLQAIPTDALAQSLASLSKEDLPKRVAREAVNHLEHLFENAQAPGSQMAARAVGILENPATIAASCETLVRDLLSAYRAIRKTET